MVQQLRVLLALAEDLSSVLRSHMVILQLLVTPTLWDPTPPGLGHLNSQVHIHTPTQTHTCIHNFKINLKREREKTHTLSECGEDVEGHDRKMGRWQLRL